MPQWLSEVLEKSNYFMPHGHCYLWMPSLLWLNVISDALIGVAYLGISLILYLLVQKIRLPFSPVFIAFGLFIGLCGLTHFMKVWTVWNPDYLLDGLVKAATAAASVATAIGLFFVRPQIEEVVHTARLSEERRIRLESSNAELEALYKKITELDELKTQFFANVSHELRTPLALILGPAERMRDDANLLPEQTRHLESISRNAKSLLKQVNDLLDVSKLEAGKAETRYARLDLVTWLRRIASQFESTAEQRRIRYRLTLPETLPAEVDPDMLERVFLNLLSNAFKFTPPDGAIDVVLTNNENEFAFYVADTGPGIDVAQHQTIFERFRQANGGSTRVHGGTGLGLAIVKDFVTLHGGRVDVTSALGEGAKFVVHLPLSAPASVEVHEAPHALGAVTTVAVEAALHELSSEGPGGAVDAPQTHSPSHPSVLVVEDNREMRSFIAGIIGVEYNVITADDGQEGLERALALQPDLIVTDIMMPRMSGDKLVAALRTRGEFDAVPILLLTAKTEDDLRVELLQSGAQDYLIKPFPPRELLARAGNLIAMKRAGDTLRTELSSASKDVEGLAKALSVKHRQLQTALATAEVAREQAERASQVKSNFLAMISHEMRTPLSTIHMNAQMLAHPSNIQPMPAAFKARIGRLTRATQQIFVLIEGLLEYVRVESGNLALRFETVDAGALAREVIDMHVDRCTPEVRLTLEAVPADLPPLQSDPRLLRIVLSNLVSNALKFTRQGAVTMRLSGLDGWLVFEVVDTGIGIDEADVSRIFLPFEQVEPVRRKSTAGVGLGLALVKEIVEALNGGVEVESKAGQGSVFRIRLPGQFRSDTNA